MNDNPRITGTVPSEIGLLSNLVVLRLNGTNLSGSVPREVCRLKQNGTLDRLEVDCSLVACSADCGCDCYKAQVPYGYGPSGGVGIPTCGLVSDVLPTGAMASPGLPPGGP